jgi:hypothetical protein
MHQLRARFAAYVVSLAATAGCSFLGMVDRTPSSTGTCGESAVFLDGVPAVLGSGVATLGLLWLVQPDHGNDNGPSFDEFYTYLVGGGLLIAAIFGGSAVYGHRANRACERIADQRARMEALMASGTASAHQGSCPDVAVVHRAIGESDPASRKAFEQDPLVADCLDQIQRYERCVSERDTRFTEASESPTQGARVGLLASIRVCTEPSGLAVKYRRRDWALDRSVGAAIAASNATGCELVDVLDAEVAALYPHFHSGAFTRQPDIAACLKRAHDPPSEYRRACLKERAAKTLMAAQTLGSLPRAHILDSLPTCETP